MQAHLLPEPLPEVSTPRDRLTESTQVLGFQPLSVALYPCPPTPYQLYLYYLPGPKICGDSDSTTPAGVPFGRQMFLHVTWEVESGTGALPAFQVGNLSYQS